MADQKRWFKLWCSAPSDDDLLSLPPELRWAWVVLGCYTKQHGTAGAVKVSTSNVVLAAQMGVSASVMLETIALLPHLYLSDAPIRWPHGHDKAPVCEGEYVRGGDPPNGRGSSYLEEWCSRNGGIIVTWKNWNKYQEDSTVYERVQRLRSKRRGEENKTRGDKELLPIAPQRGARHGFRTEGTNPRANGTNPRARTLHPTPPCYQILEWLNTKAGRTYRASAVNLTFIQARLNDGIADWQLKAIVSRKCREWANTDQAKYLRPATLFNKTKCEQYLGELPKEVPHGGD